MNTKKLTLVCLLLLLTTTLLHAQANWAIQPANDSLYQQEIREKLALDYSMPDYTTRKIDPKVMGPRLSSILQNLFDNYQHANYLSILSSIQSEQIEGLDYCLIEKIDFKEASKYGNKIAVHLDTTLERNHLGIKKSDLIITFIDGLSSNKTVNSMFANICNYLK